MDLCRCENGHFYDREKHPTCPHCVPVVEEEETPTTAYTEEAAVEDLPSAEDFQRNDYANEAEYVEPEEEDITEEAEFYEPEPIEEEEEFYEPEQEEYVPEAPAYDDDDDHTVAFVDELVNEVVGEKTPEVRNPGRATSPCVGWLVAINGAHVGQDFRLKTGRNFIGRDAEMDVALTGDKSVSRDRHAIITYEPKKHIYLIQPGESSGLVYFNDEVVLNPIRIDEKDESGKLGKITIGDVDLVFIPLCSDSFNWDEQLGKMKNGQ